jgi:MinD-like ATPase involved in chromosome partitioning or flagellar assembly
MTRAKVKENIVQHTSGMKILPASAQPRDGVLINNIQHFEIILNRMTFMSRYVVIDLGSGITPLNQKIAPVLNEILVVAEPFENSLMHTRAMLEDLAGIGVEKSRLHVVVNYRLRSESQLSVPQVQEKLKFSIDVTFTPAPELLIQAVRMQTTAVIAQPESLTTQQYTSLANKISSRAPKPARV